MHKILIVEDEPLIAEDLGLLVQQAGYTVAGIAYNGTSALDMLHSQQPDLALLDISLDGQITGLDIAQVIHEKYQLPYIFITSFSDKYTLDRVKNLKPAGYLLKPFKKKDILVNIELALHSYKKEQDSAFLTLEELNEHIGQTVSPREYEIMLDVVKGLSNKELCDKYFVSLNTIKTHLKRVFTKLDVSSRTQIAAAIMRK